MRNSISKRSNLSAKISTIALIRSLTLYSFLEKKKKSFALLKLEEMEKIINSFCNPNPELLYDLSEIHEIISRDHILLHRLGDD